MMMIQSRHAAMGEMISMIAHQWRQPISTISMGANNILLDIEFDDIQSEQLKSVCNTILNQTQYLTQTIDDFRDFFRPNKEVEEYAVEHVFSEVLAIIGTSLKNHNIDVKREYNSKSKVYTYSRELVQVCINLVKNAKEVLVESRVQNPCIILQTREDKNSVYVSVLDNGPGILEENKFRIFEPYFTTKKATEGTGLGLYMSKTIVEKHLEGSLRFVDRGKWTCFEIVLPKHHSKEP